MLDDLIGQLVGEAMFGRLSRSRKAQILFRLFFGAVGAALGLAGAVYFATRPDLTANAALRTCMILVFVFLSCFSLFNVALARPWRWPGLLFVASFVAMFVVRIAFGS